MIRYLATFTPEAWQNDNAVEVDAAGQREWDASAMVQAHLDYFESEARNQGETFDLGVVDRSDLLKDDPAAPTWVRTWTGPFTIRVRVTD